MASSLKKETGCENLPVTALWTAVAVAQLLAAPPAPGLTAGQVEAVKSAYSERRAHNEVESHPVDARPAGVRLVELDVTPRIRSASFGHRTTLLVRLEAADGGSARPVEFWVEYGPSTNTRARIFGPFALP